MLARYCVPETCQWGAEGLVGFPDCHGILFFLSMIQSRVSIEKKSLGLK